jgi:hypothetical protein
MSFRVSGKIKMLLVSIAFAIFSGLFAWKAATNEIAGTAFYLDPKNKYNSGYIVTCDSSPEKFRSANNLLWGTCLVGGLFSGLFFTLYRKLDDCE